MQALGVPSEPDDGEAARVQRVEKLLCAPEPLHDWLAREIDWPDGCRLEAVRRSRIWPGKKGSLTCELSLTVSRAGHSESFLLQGKAEKANPERTVHKTPRFGLGGYLLGIRVASEELGISLWSPDHDTHLPGASKMLGNSDGSACSDQPSGARPPLNQPASDASPARFSIVAYRAAKRCTFAQYLPDSDEIRAYVKVFRRMPAILHEDRLSTFAAALEARSGGKIRIPPPEQICVDQRMLVSRPVAFGSKEARDGSTRVRCAAELLAALHDLSLDFSDKLSVHDADKELETVQRWLGCGHRFGHMPADEATSLLGGMTSLAKAAATPPARIAHRDFYESQLQHDADHTYLTDLDTVALAHGEVDVATYIAHEFLDALSSDKSVDSAKRQGEAFVAHYMACGGRIDPGRLRFYMGCAMVRLGCIHVLRGVDKCIIESLWGIGRSQVERSWEIAGG